MKESEGRDMTLRLQEKKLSSTNLKRRTLQVRIIPKIRRIKRMMMSFLDMKKWET